MKTLSLQAVQNDIIRQVLNTRDINLLQKVSSLFAGNEANDDSCMTKDDVLSGFDGALHELKAYREGNLELKPLEEVLGEL